MNRIENIIIFKRNKFCNHDEEKKFWNKWEKRKHWLEIKGFPIK